MRILYLAMPDTGRFTCTCETKQALRQCNRYWFSSVTGVYIDDVHSLSITDKLRIEFVRECSLWNTVHSSCISVFRVTAEFKLVYIDIQRCFAASQLISECSAIYVHHVVLILRVYRVSINDSKILCCDTWVFAGDRECYFFPVNNLRQSIVSVPNWHERSTENVFTVQCETVFIRRVFRSCSE